MTENMRIWDAVSKTNPANTKNVNQRGGFTAINANSQIMEATRQFGPIGIGWGYSAGTPIFHETLLFVPVTLWHGERSNTFGPVLGCEEWKVKDRVDSDAGKKATTDAVTKLLSQLGFNADVFLGLYDDQKYVAELKREFAAAPQHDRTANTEANALRDEIVTLAGVAGVSLADIAKRADFPLFTDIPDDLLPAIKRKLNLTLDTKIKEKENA